MGTGGRVSLPRYSTWLCLVLYQSTRLCPSCPYCTPHTIPSPPSLPPSQAVFNVTKARYPLKDADYHTLAGIQAATYISEHPDIGTSLGALRPFMDIFYPPHLSETVGGKKSIGKLFRQKSVEQSLVEDLFRVQYESMQAKSAPPHDLKILYLQYCWSKPFYG